MVFAKLVREGELVNKGLVPLCQNRPTGQKLEVCRDIGLFTPLNVRIEVFKSIDLVYYLKVHY